MSQLNIDSIANQLGTGGPDFVGMPTVAGDPVVESGSNSDGEWVRWADGTQVVRKFQVKSVPINVPSGAGWRNLTVDGSLILPASFIGTAGTDFKSSVVVGGQAYAPELDNIIGIQQVEHETLGEIRAIVSSAISETIFVPFSVLAVGRWK